SDIEAPRPTPRAASGTTLTVVAGDNQTAALVMTDHGFPIATFEPVAVVLRDATGVPLGGKDVAWSVGETPGNMGVQMDPHGTDPCIVVTDEHGVATLDRMRGRSASAFYGYGAFTLVASHAGASVAARMTVATPVVLLPAIVSGDNQRVARTGDRVPGGEARFAPVKVRLKDSQGRPAPGIEVAFAAVGPPGMTIQLSPGSSDAAVTTDAEGIVTLDLMDGDSMVCSGSHGELKDVVTTDDTKPIVSHHSGAPRR